MKKVIYNKLLLQAEEAKDQGLFKLASGILKAIESFPEDIDVKYEKDELNKDIYETLWQLVNNLIEYHNIESVDAQKVDSVIESFTEDFINQVEEALGVQEQEESEEDSDN